jgi:hypothetical protein
MEVVVSITGWNQLSLANCHWCGGALPRGGEHTIQWRTSVAPRLDFATVCAVCHAQWLRDGQIRERVSAHG